MAAYSKYPGQLDDSSSLPASTDNVTPVKAEVVNRLRDAILAIEAELGIDPSREYGTVRARLDAMDGGGGGGGGSGFVSVGYHLTTVVAEATVLTFEGDAVVTAGAPHQAIVTIVGTTRHIRDIFTPATNQTSFTLSETPLTTSVVLMYNNGLLQSSLDYSVSGTTVTYSGLGLITSDRVEFTYFTNISLVGDDYTLTVQETSVTVDSEVTTIDFIGNVSVTSVIPGTIQVDVGAPEGSKIRVYRSTTQAGGAVTVPETVVWDTLSGAIDDVNASQTGGNTQITPSESGLFTIAGQLAIEPTAGSIDGVTVEVLRNSVVIHTATDFGAVWTSGVTNTIDFITEVELSASDLLEVQWTHEGSLGSTTQLMSGDDQSWFSFNKVNSASATFSVATFFTVTTNKTSLYSANINELVQCDPSGGAFSVNLPTAGGNTGKHIVIKNVTSSTNTITVVASGLETIDGSATQPMNIGYEALYLVSNGSGWLII